MSRRSSSITGRVVDAEGRPLIASHASKGTIRYRYYVSEALQQGTASTVSGSRIPALELETAVCERIAQALDDPLALAGKVGLVLVSATLPAALTAAAEAAARLRRRDRTTTQALVRRVMIHTARMDIEINAHALGEALQLGVPTGAVELLTLTAQAMLTRSGRAMRLVRDNGATVGNNTNASIIRLVVKARGWWKVLRQGELDITSLAAREGVQPSYLTRVLRLAFLSSADPE